MRRPVHGAGVSPQMSRMSPLLSIDAIAVKAAVSSFLRTHAVRTNCVAERLGVWDVLGFVVPLKERISASRLKPRLTLAFSIIVMRKLTNLCWLHPRLTI